MVTTLGYLFAMSILFYAFINSGTMLLSKGSCIEKRRRKKKTSYGYYTRVYVCNVYTVLCIHKFRDNASL